MRALRRHGALGLGAAGLLALVLALALRSSDADDAAGQVWPPFVLVSGLLLVGLVSEEDGLFAAAGHGIARRTRSGLLLYAGAVLLIAVVASLLNLDTAVAFLTPVLVYTAESRGGGEGALLYSCILLANAGSLILPGSNLTNLIVLGDVHLTGGAFFRTMALPGIASILVTAAVVALLNRRDLHGSDGPDEAGERPRFGVGLIAIAISTVLVIVMSNPAIPVAAVGVVAVLLRTRSWRAQGERVLEVLGLPILVGLFGIAVALGTIGRAWSGPETLLSHLGPWATAGVAAGASVLVNNLPAASLLSARSLNHPFPLLVGLNIGPNLFVTGSLAWMLWWRSARTAGASPSLRRAAVLGVLSAPLAIVAAMAVLVASGHG